MKKTYINIHMIRQEDVELLKTAMEKEDLNMTQWT